MIYLPTFTTKINRKGVNMPHLDTMGYINWYIYIPFLCAIHDANIQGMDFWNVDFTWISCDLYLPSLRCRRPGQDHMASNENSGQGTMGSIKLDPASHSI